MYKLVRQDLWELKQSEKICAIDLDECLCCYIDEWLKFINSKLGTHYDNLFEAKKSIPYQTYKDLKEDYRTCGVKEHLQLKPFAKEFMYGLKKLGYMIVIISKRPVWLYPTLYRQTVSWLVNNKIPWDGLVFDDQKHVRIVSDLPHLKFFVEDHRYYVNLVAKWGYRAYLLNTKYNQGELHPNVLRVNNLLEILEDVKRGTKTK